MRWKKRAASLGVLGSLALLAGCGSGGTPEVALAIVDGHPITAAAWRTALKATAVVTGRALSSRQAATATEVQALVRQQVVTDYVLTHHLVSAVRAQRQAATYVETTLRPRLHGQLAVKLAQAHLSEAAFLGYVRQQMILSDAFLLMKAPASPSDAAIDQYYQAHASQFTTPTTVEVRQILVKSRPQAESLLVQLKKGASFAALAARYSLDESSALAGGSLGYLERGKASGLLPNFYRTMDALKPGQYGIAHTRLGYHIIEVQAVKPGSEADLSTVKPIIKAELMTSDKMSVFDAWASRLQREAKVKILKT